MSVQTLIDNTPVRSEFELPQALPPKSARVVIVGGGIVGCSVAYHLAKAGWDVTLLEQGRLGSGTTWHAAGMVGQLRASNSMTRINKYSAWLYPRLQEETGHDVGWVRTRGLTLGTNEERMSQLRRTAAMADVFGVEAHLVSPREARDLWPLIQVDDVLGAVYLPGDGRVIPGECTVALAKGAMAHGARLFDQVRVEGLKTQSSPRGKGAFNRITGVEYRTADGDAGEVDAEWVLLTGGMWARQLGLTIGVDLPLYAVEHHYVLSEPIEGASRDFPCARDPDAAIYFRTLDDGAIKLGGFQARSKPWPLAESVPSDFAFKLLEDDWEKFSQPLEAGQRRIPALRSATFRQFVNGPESFTPDNNFLMGPPARTEGLFVLAGFNSVGIASAGGVGKYAVEWLEGGEAPMDLWSVDVRRFIPKQNGAGYLKARSAETLGLHYQMAWPNREMETARDMRRTPLHERTTAFRACYGQTAGWERPLWYAPPGVTPEISYSFKKQNWAPIVAEEVNACRSSAALFDQSTFSKFELSGVDTLRALQWLCGNNVDVPIGRIVYTGMFNHRGTFVSDVTVVRRAEDQFRLITSTQQGPRDADWILRGISAADDVSLKDITEEVAVVSIMGPNARRILSRVTDADLSAAAFPFGQSAVIRIDGHTALALRVTYVGELGWELQVDAAAAPDVWDALMKAGEPENIRPAGVTAINTMRIEKAYRAFGSELSADENPFEAGLSFAIDWDKDFLGKTELLRLKNAPRMKRLVSLALQVDDPTVTLWGNEPIFRNERLVGYTSSGCFSPTLGQPLAMGYVKHPDGAAVDKKFLLDGDYTILNDGTHWPAAISLKPPVDPKRERILA